MISLFYSTQKIQEEQILRGINRINKHLTFKITREDNNRINFLDLTIIRNKNNMEVNIHRKETSTDTVIHSFSNHPIEQKLAAFRVLYQ